MIERRDVSITTDIGLVPRDVCANYDQARRVLFVDFVVDSERSISVMVTDKGVTAALTRRGPVIPGSGMREKILAHREQDGTVVVLVPEAHGRPSCVAKVRLGETDKADANFRKADNGKPRPSLLPAGALLDVVAVLEHGAKKYGVDNWRKVDDNRRYLDAAMRHMLAVMADGLDAEDGDSGLPHLAHAACSILFLLELRKSESGS